MSILPARKPVQTEVQIVENSRNLGATRLFRPRPACLAATPFVSKSSGVLGHTLAPHVFVVTHRHMPRLQGLPARNQRVNLPLPAWMSEAF